MEVGEGWGGGGGEGKAESPCLTALYFHIQHVDPVVARSFAQLAAVAVKKHALESDPLLVSE